MEKQNIFMPFLFVFLTTLLFYPNAQAKFDEINNNNHISGCKFDGSGCGKNWKTSTKVGPCDIPSQRGEIHLCADKDAYSFISELDCPAGYTKFSGAVTSFNGDDRAGYRVADTTFGYYKNDRRDLPDSSLIYIPPRFTHTCVDLAHARRFLLLRQVGAVENKCPEGFKTVAEKSFGTRSTLNKAFACEKVESRSTGSSPAITTNPGAAGTQE